MGQACLFGTYPLKAAAFRAATRGRWRWLHEEVPLDSFAHKMKCVTSSDVFDEIRSDRFLEAMSQDWYREIPPVVIPADPANGNRWGFLPFVPGGDSRSGEAKVKENPAPGLTRIAGLVEAHDLIYGQVLSLETLVKQGAAPSKFTKSLNLPDGKTAEAILFVDHG